MDFAARCPYHPAMRIFGRLWRGEMPLADAFWTWAAIGGLLVNAVTTAGCLMLISADRPVLGLAVGYGLAIPYNIFVTIGVWRAAARYTGDPKWAALARGVTLAGMIVMSLT